MVSLLEAEVVRKPHLRRKHGVWSCRSIGLDQHGKANRWVIGFGYTPAQAYSDWKAQK